MGIIKTETIIHAPVERVFLLSLSTDVHIKSTGKTHEKAIDGITKGVMKLGDRVTWQAKHLGITQKLSSTISAYERPHYFVSEMYQGVFKKLYHQHVFQELNPDTCIMTDIMEVRAPFGLLGLLAEKTFLDKYMKKFLRLRNECIKSLAESEEWRLFLTET